jgi:hypothetical protein
MPLLAGIDWNWLLRNNDFPLVVFTASIPILVIVVLVAIYGYGQKTLQARLKERMIERGFTAEEIIAVINAGEGRGQGRKGATRVNDPTSQPDCLKTSQADGSS